MARKIVKTAPFSDNVEMIYYSDGTKGLRSTANRNYSNQESADHGMDGVSEARPGIMDEAPASPEEIHDLEAQLSRHRDTYTKLPTGYSPLPDKSIEENAKLAEENYYRDQRFRGFSDAMSAVDSLPEGSAVSDQEFSKAIELYPDYLKPMHDGQIEIQGYFNPKKQKGGS